MIENKKTKNNWVVNGFIRLEAGNTILFSMQKTDLRNFSITGEERNLSFKKLNYKILGQSLNVLEYILTFHHLRSNPAAKSKAITLNNL